MVYVSRLVHQYVVKLDESSEHAISKDKTFYIVLSVDRFVGLLPLAKTFFACQLFLLFNLTLLSSTSWAGPSGRKWAEPRCGRS